MGYQFHLTPDIKNMNEVKMMVGNEEFRIDRGVTFTFKKYVDELRREQLTSLIAGQKELKRLREGRVWFQISDIREINYKLETRKH